MFALKRSVRTVLRSYPVQWISRPTFSTQAFVAPVTKSANLPEGVSLEVLDERHDVTQLKCLLARAFVGNNEPIVTALGELHYPTLSTLERVPLIEERIKKLFCEESLSAKIQDGLSVVAVEDNDRRNVVSVLFAERYRGEVYEKASLVDDSLCQTGLNLMRCVHMHAKVMPALNCCDPNATMFLSHAATHPRYQSMGIIVSLYLAATEHFVASGMRTIFCITTAKMLTKCLTGRLGFDVIAEVLYVDYEDGGRKVFEKLADKDVSAKALISYL